MELITIPSQGMRMLKKNIHDGVVLYKSSLKTGRTARLLVHHTVELCVLKIGIFSVPSLII